MNAQSELREMSAKVERIERANRALREEIESVRKMWKKTIDEKRETCCWGYDEIYNAWSTSCNNSFVIIEGTPAQNDMKYCPYCGNAIKENDACDNSNYQKQEDGDN